MDNSVEFENGLFGTKAIIRGIWQEPYLEIFNEKKVQELELNDGKGWCGNNIEFIKFLPKLKSLSIIDLRINSIESIHSLNGLKKLKLITYSKKPINFSNFPELEQCDFEWVKGSESLFRCNKLTRLSLNRFDNKTSTLFSNLNKLEKLTIMNSAIEDLVGLENLIQLNYLSITNLKNLSSLIGLQDLIQLEELEIYKCKKVSEISILLKLTNLRRLLLIDIGNILSIKGLENLTNLREFLFYESTNIIDGDLFPLTKLNFLHKISFQNRKHYSHKRENFQKQFS